MRSRTQRQTQRPAQCRKPPQSQTLIVVVHTLRVVSERPVAVGAAVSERIHFTDVEIPDGLCDLSVSMQEDAAAVWTALRSECRDSP